MFEIIKNIGEILQILISILILLSSIFITTYISYYFASVVQLNIDHKRFGENNQFLHISYSFKNISKIRIYKPKMYSIIKCISHENLSDIDFRFDWNSENKEQINSTTSIFYPGEEITYEKLYKLESPSDIVQIGFKVKMTVSWIIKFLNRKKTNRFAQTIYKISHIENLI